MLIKKYTFRPAWLLFVGPGLLLAMLLAAGVIVSAHRGMISAPVALRLHLLPNLVLAAFYACWRTEGRLVLKPNQVVLQGWAKVKPESGRARRAYVQRHVPRSEWHTLHVSGLLLGTVTWTDGKGTTIVLRHLSRAMLLKQLLQPQQQDRAYSSLTQQLYAHRARGLGLLRAFALLRFLLHAGVTLIQRVRRGHAHTARSSRSCTALGTRRTALPAPRAASVLPAQRTALPCLTAACTVRRGVYPARF
jgi:hypothetical protein